MEKIEKAMERKKGCIYRVGGEGVYVEGGNPRAVGEDSWE